MSYNPNTVKKMIGALPSHFALARYVLVVVEAMQGVQNQLAFKSKEIDEFVMYCASCWNEAHPGYELIEANELSELIIEQIEFETKQHLRMSQLRP